MVPIESTQTLTQTVPLVKRKRGRPPKDPNAVKIPAQKRPRGRPKKTKRGPPPRKSVDKAKKPKKSSSTSSVEKGL